MLPSFSQFQGTPPAHYFMPSPSPITFKSPVSWQQERQNVSPSGIQTQPSAVGAQLCNYQATNPCCVTIAHLNYISNHSLGLILDTFHFHENWLVTCFPRAPGFGCSNQQHNFLPSMDQYPPHSPRVS